MPPQHRLEDSTEDYRSKIAFVFSTTEDEEDTFDPRRFRHVPVVLMIFENAFEY